jgi:hypothetical protein
MPPSPVAWLLEAARSQLCEGVENHDLTGSRGLASRGAASVQRHDSAVMALHVPRVTPAEARLFQPGAAARVSINLRR